MAQLPRPNKFADNLFDVLVYFGLGMCVRIARAMLFNCALRLLP